LYFREVRDKLAVGSQRKRMFHFGREIMNLFNHNRRPKKRTWYNFSKNFETGKSLGRGKRKL